MLCVLGECVCVWSPTTSGTKGAGPAWLPLFVCGSGGVRDVHVLICTRVVQIGVACVYGTAAVETSTIWFTEIWGFVLCGAFKITVLG